MDISADGVPKISSSCVSNENDDLKSFQFIPSPRKPLGEYVDGKSFPLFMDNIENHIEKQTRDSN